MARRNSADVILIQVGGYDLIPSGIIGLEETIEGTPEEMTAFSDTWRQLAFPGVRTAKLSLEGYYDDAAYRTLDGLTTGPGISRVACFGYEGSATGAAFTGWEGAMQVDFERQLTLGQFTKVRATFQNNGTVERGKIVRMFNAASATGASTGTPLDNAVSATGGSGYLSGFNGAGLGEANFRLLHSSDNITYTTLLTFAKTTTAPFAERLQTTAVIERYTAMDVTTASATGNIGNLYFFGGLARGAFTS